MSGPFIVKRDPKAIQAANLRDLLQRNATSNVDLWRGYQYIAENIRGDRQIDPRLAEWADTAAAINGPDPSWIKEFVFSNNENLGLDVTRLKNQEASNV